MSSITWTSSADVKWMVLPAWGSPEAWCLVVIDSWEEPAHMFPNSGSVVLWLEGQELMATIDLCRLVVGPFFLLRVQISYGIHRRRVGLLVPNHFFSSGDSPAVRTLSVRLPAFRNPSVVREACPGWFRKCRNVVMSLIPSSDFLATGCDIL